MQALELLVSKSADVDAQEADGQTPLHYAALSEHEAVSSGPVLSGISFGMGDVTRMHLLMQAHHTVWTQHTTTTCTVCVA